MVYRVYVEKRAPYGEEARRAMAEFSALPGAGGIERVRLLNRYDVEGLDEALFRKCLPVVFAEPQVDELMFELPEADAAFAVEYLPGQFDQRADSCAECIQLVSQSERPAVASAKVYLLYGELAEGTLEELRMKTIYKEQYRQIGLKIVGDDSVCRKSRIKGNKVRTS